MGKRLAFACAAASIAVLSSADSTEVHWVTQNGDMSVLSNWLTHTGDWNFNVPVQSIDHDSDLRIYGAGELSLGMAGDMTAHTLKAAPNGGDLKVTIDASGHTLSFADKSGAPEWGDWEKGISVAGSQYTGTWQTGWLVLAGGTFTGNACLRAAGEGRSDEGHARLTVTGAGTRVEGVKGDVSCGDSATDCTLEITYGAYVRAGRGVRNGDAVDASNNVIRISGEGSRLEMQPTGDASYLPDKGHDNSVVAEYGGTLANVQNSGGWYGATYVGKAATATGNSLSATNGGHLDFSGGGEVRIGFNGASSNVMEVDGEGSTAILYEQLAIGSGASPSNRLVVSNGGKVAITGYSSSYLGWGAGSDGNSATVAGVGSEFVLSNMFMYVGFNGACGNSLVVADGGYAAAKHFFIGSGESSARNTVKVTGTGSVLKTLDYDVSVGNGGHDNSLEVEDGATLVASRSIFLGGGEGVSDIGSCTNNTLRIFNATLSQPVNYDIAIAGGCRLTVGGSRLATDTPWLHAMDGSELEFVFDSEGIAPFETRWETFLVKEDGSPALSKIIIDARKFVKARGLGTFTLMRAKGGHSCRLPNGNELSAEEYVALNAEMAKRVVCLPGYLQPSFDMAHSTITVTVPRFGMAIIIR